MSQSPIAYWRNQKKQQQLLGKKGVIVSVTKIEGVYTGMIEIEGTTLSTEIIAYSQKPKPQDEVVTVLRIVHVDGRAGLIQYGIKCKCI